MDPEKSGETAIKVEDPKSKSKGKGIFSVTTRATPVAGRGKKGIAIFDLVVRLAAIASGLAATSLMATLEQTLPFFTQFFQFHAEYNDIPEFVFFFIANAIASGYLVLSLPFSIFCIVRPHAAGPRLFLIIFDTVVMAFLIAAASAAASTLNLAHNGNSSTNWNPICQQFNDFCQQASIAVTASFITAALFVFLVIISAFALKRTY